MVFVAHAGHWLMYVLYAVPILIVVGSIVVSIVRQRHGGDAERTGPRRGASADGR